MSDRTNALRRLYLNGKWVAPENPLAVENPATGEIIAHVGTVQRPAVGRAIADADRAWADWRATPGRARGALLDKIADIIERRADEFARMITLENGKPLAQSRGELGVTIDHLRWYAGEAQRGYGRVVPQQVPEKRHMVLRVPVGVVGAIAPWNFPLVLAVRKAAPALAAGCPVILKPASATPLSSVMLAEAVDEAGLPPGVFQLVVGDSAMIGAEMLDNPVCRKITFTGSTAVGQHLVRGAARNLTKLSLELGGHAPVLVFDDADIEQAVEGTVIAKFRNTGQSCIAANRIYVQRSIADTFTAALAEAVRELKVGDGFEDGVEIGPLIDKQTLDGALEHVADAVNRGAKVLCGGKRWEGSTTGHYLEPTLLAEVPDDAVCMRDETFAPVAPISVFDDEAEAVRSANATRYGLAAYAFTRDLSRAWRLAESLEAGTVGINHTVPATSQCPFGGMKQSGWGRELGTEGLDAFLETKHISIGIEPTP